MQLRLLNFATLTQNMAAAVQASSARLIDLSVGSVLRAVLEANAGVALWVQWLILRVLQNTRAATSAGVDLDSWMSDFSLPRLPAVAASGVVSFARITPGLAALVPVGTLVRTADGVRSFGVMADLSNPAFDASQSAYLMAPDALMLNAPVLATVAGEAGNVLANSVTQLASALPGIDMVSNDTAMTNGAEAETDAALRARFTDFMDTRSRATRRAVSYAATGVQQGLQHVIAENVDTAGVSRVGHFVVTVDDGSGMPSTALLDAVTVAIEAVRPLGSSFTVQPPVMNIVDIAATLTLADEAEAAAVRASVGTAIARYVNALPIGGALPLSRIAQIAHDADASVRMVGPVLLNNAAMDVVPAANAVIKTGVVTVA